MGALLQLPQTARRAQWEDTLRSPQRKTIINKKGRLTSNRTLHAGIEGAALSGFTNSGHPLAMAATQAALDVYAEDGIAAHVREISAHVASRFREEFMPLPIVGDIDGAGLMLGLEIVADKATRERLPAEVMGRIMTRTLKKGLITRGKGSRVAFCPPLVITKEEADLAVDILYDVLKTLLD